MTSPLHNISSLNKQLLERLFIAASIRRWNDKATPLEFVEIDKQAHKIILAYIFAKYEENIGHNIDFTKLIQQFLFEFFERMERKLLSSVSDN